MFTHNTPPTLWWSLARRELSMASPRPARPAPPRAPRARTRCWGALLCPMCAAPPSRCAAGARTAAGGRRGSHTLHAAHTHTHTTRKGARLDIRTQGRATDSHARARDWKRSIGCLPSPHTHARRVRSATHIHTRTRRACTQLPHRCSTRARPRGRELEAVEWRSERPRHVRVRMVGGSGRGE